MLQSVILFIVLSERDESATRIVQYVRCTCSRKIIIILLFLLLLVFQLRRVGIVISSAIWKIYETFCTNLLSLSLLSLPLLLLYYYYKIILMRYWSSL
jgi:hypothetical protein